MKKLIISAAIAFSAIAVSAANVKWSSGAIQTPTSDADGTLSGNKLNTSSGFNVKMYVWEALAESGVSYTAGDLFKWYQNGASSTKDPFGGNKTAITVTPTTGASATTAIATGTLVPSTEGASVYGAILFVLEDATSGAPKWYMENTGSKATGKATQTLANLALKVGGGSSTIPTAWVPAVPEPTSAMLMLLGMAGLALRRKRA